MPVARLREAILEYLSDARSDSVEVQQKALYNLASMTKVSLQNRSLLAQTEGAISNFIMLTKSSSPIIETLALAILFNLSLNLDLKQSLADMNTILRLNSIIISPRSPESSRLACSLVCSLAMLDKNKAKFGVAGTIQILVDAISGPRGPASHHLLSSLAELVQFHGNCTLAVRSGAVPVLMGIIESPDGEDLAGSSLAILVLLVRFEEGLNAIIGRERIVSCMVEVLKRRCMLSKEGAGEILLRIFDESEGCVRDALRLPELSTVLADLSVRGSSKAREKAAQLMKKMTEASSDPGIDGNSMFLQWY
ncbi:hypothetical protein P3X46_019361 [Hevea brasiliensis]|uniref:U-box domain-containing protein n=1 Tax=Hevea brasiliensis TaxID=3981 RepID=A0ABQ9LJQ2_HEVBR|nr:uncharacterized protein LOC110657859 [Hevea brasiliensis]KAJ9167763.1 hypothetical protein P3X46_019361 [Hevea brasiliensis]